FNSVSSHRHTQPPSDIRLSPSISQRQPNAKPRFRGAHQPRRLRAPHERVNEIAIGFRSEPPQSHVTSGAYGPDNSFSDHSNRQYLHESVIRFATHNSSS